MVVSILCSTGRCAGIPDSLYSSVIKWACVSYRAQIELCEGGEGVSRSKVSAMVLFASKKSYELITASCENTT